MGLLLVCILGDAGAAPSRGEPAAAATPPETAPPVRPCAANQVRIGAELSARLDAKGALGVLDVARDPGAFSPWSPFRGSGFSQGNLWLKLRLENASGERCDRWLIVTPNLQKDVDLYLISPDGTVRTVRGGANVALEKRAVQSLRHAVFPLTLAPRETRDAYLALRGDAARVFEVALWEPGRFLDYQGNRDTTVYLLFGASALVFFACLIAARIQRKPGLLFGSAAWLFALLYALARDGYLTSLFPGDVVSSQQLVMQISSALFVGSQSLFCNAYLPLTKYSRHAQRGLYAIAAAAIVLCATAVFVSVPQIAVVFAGLSIAMITAITVDSALRAGGDTWIYLAGWVVIGLAIVARIMHALGWLPLRPAYAEFVGPLAFGVSALTTSLALYRSLAAAQNAADSANRALLQQRVSQSDRLRAAVAESTAQLRDALQSVEAANREKSRFLATAAHEFRSQLHTVLGNTMLTRRWSSAEGQAHLDAIERAGDALVDLVDRTLQVGRADSAPVDLDLVPVSLESLINDLINSLQAKHRSAPGRLRFEFKGAVPERIVADEQKLRRVLDNVAENAFKYAPSGSITIGVEVLEESLPPAARDDCRLRFSVRDEGPGIAPERHAEVFEPFSRVSTDKRQHGLGLGLTICQQLLGAMGSRLQLVSQAGQGACFFFDLRVPLASASGELVGPRSAVAEDPSEVLRRPEDHVLAEARQLLEFGQLVALEGWAKARQRERPELEAFVGRVLACCAEVDLEGLSRLLGPADPATAPKRPPRP